MFSIEEYVTAGRTDADGRLKIVSAIDMMQDCSQLWMKSEPVLSRYFALNNIAQLLASRQIDILRLPQYGEKLTTTTSVFEMQTIQGFRNTVIYDEEKKPCIASWTTGAFVCLDNNRLSKLPDEIQSSLVLDPRYEMEYVERRIITPKEGWEKLSPVKVMRFDIDMNRHMNNVHYIRIALELLPDNFEVSRLRIEYKLPAKQGDLLYPQTLMQDDKIYVMLTNEKGQIHANMEFGQVK